MKSNNSPPARSFDLVTAGDVRFPLRTALACKSSSSDFAFVKSVLIWLKFDYTILIHFVFLTEKMVEKYLLLF